MLIPGFCTRFLWVGLPGMKPGTLHLKQAPWGILGFLRFGSYLSCGCFRERKKDSGKVASWDCCCFDSGEQDGKTG